MTSSPDTPTGGSNILLTFQVLSEMIYADRDDYPFRVIFCSVSSKSNTQEAYGRVIAFDGAYFIRTVTTTALKKLSSFPQMLGMTSSGMWHSVGLIKTDVSEGGVASIFRVEEIYASDEKC
jgi:hypothetical protein